MNVALITASGVGSRTHQDIPKQFFHVNDKPIIIYTLEAFQRHPQIDEICLVILKGWENILWAYAKQFNITKLKYVVEGGATGQESIYNGVCEIYKHYEGKDATIIIHDGNRPLVSETIISDNLAVFAKYGSAVTSIPCVEVAMYSEDKIQSDVIVEREYLQRTQTPHSYLLEELYNAHRVAIENHWDNMAAMPVLMQKLGKKTYFSRGSEKNLKITTIDDLEIFKSLLVAERAPWLK